MKDIVSYEHLSDKDLFEFAAGFYKGNFKRTGMKRLCAQSRSRLGFIRKTYKKALENAASGDILSAPFEWLCDNYYIIERETRVAIRELAYCRSLPLSADPKYKGLPACYAAAEALCDSSELLVTSGRLEVFLEGLQQGYTMESIELWVFAYVLRLAVLAGIYRICAELSEGYIPTQGNLYDRDNEERLSRLLGNAIKTLRFLTTFDFSDCYERVSRMEKVLINDPSGIYKKMDEKSKAYYRSRIIEISKKLRIGEIQTAQKALSLAQSGSSERERHIGYYLIDRSLDKSKGKYRLGAAYLFLLAFLPILTALLISIYFTLPIWAFIIIIFPLWEVFKHVIDYIFSKTVKPRLIPRLDLSKGLPAEGRTLVVISSLLVSEKQISEQLLRLERFFLSNRDENICLGLLLDFKDSDKKLIPEEDGLADRLKAGIRELNRRYGSSFYVLIRQRTYNETESRYMGWERKRGALLELCRFLRGRETSFNWVEGDINRLKTVKFVVTLDSDTNLRIGSAIEMASAMLHPLNKPVVDKNKRRVVEGYGLLQPRIGVDLASANATNFSKIMSGHGGIDPYSNTVCDIYQDLFDEGIFTGKGIFDVDVFLEVLDGLFPENSILSHDLLEGCHLRAGLLSDVELTDSVPAKLSAYFDRLHRWTRGDWQISGYLLPTIKDSKGERIQNSLSRISKWKIFDNMRRSVSPIAAVACFIAAAFVDPSTALVLAIIAVISIFSSLILSVTDIFVSRNMTLVRQKYHSTVIIGIKGVILRSLLLLFVLPYHAYISLDAIIRTLWRLKVSRRNLLAWVTAAESESRGRQGFFAYLKRMWIAPVAGALLIAASDYSALKFLGLFWVVSPAIGFLSSIYVKESFERLSKADSVYLEKLTRDIWSFFEQFIGEETMNLPPDNYQESPLGVLAKRTSPTNIGLALLCCLAARDFGFITSTQLYKKLEKMFANIDRLEKYRGHLYNWYDLQKGRVMHPRYVSAVDSGNLVASLITLRQGLLEYIPECAPLAAIAEKARELSENMRFDWLYNSKRNLFYIGWDAENDTLGDGCYDLLMSEARITSYISLARREVPKKHWERLGRSLVKKDGFTGLVSWTGTMFEYFMPHMFMPIYANSLEYEAMRFALYCQKKRTQSRKLPWGISESGFYAFDSALNYQYKAFGVQRLALKRGINKELVIAPYATFLTLTLDPREAVKNLKRLEALGLYGRYSFFEAIDFTPERVGGGSAIVKSYMAHHLGMSMVSCANALLENNMIRRFMSDPTMGSAAELLQEKIPIGAVVYADVAFKDIPEKLDRSKFVGSRSDSDNPDPLSPKVHLLSNGEWTTMITDTGLGFTKFGDEAIIRFRKDKLHNPRGFFVFLSTRERAFSLAPAPCYEQDEIMYVASFTPYEAVISARAGEIESKMSVMVHGQLPVESREVTIKNESSYRKSATLLFYFEPVLAPPDGDLAHPVFSNLFVESHFDSRLKILLFCRRPREQKKGERWLAVGFLDPQLSFEFETRRDRLFPRLATTKDLKSAFSRAFSGETGACIDPAAAIKVWMQLPRRGSISVRLLMSYGKSREEVVRALETVRQSDDQNRLAVSAEADAESRRAMAMMQEQEDRLLAKILPSLIFDTPHSDLRYAALEKIDRGQRGLWKHGISGDNPILLINIDRIDSVSKLLPFLNIYKYLSLCRVSVDLVILYSEGGDYNLTFRNAIKGFLDKAGIGHLWGASTGIRVVNRADLQENEEELIIAASSYYVDFAGEEPQKLDRKPYSPQYIERRPEWKGDSGERLMSLEGSDVVINHCIEGQPLAPWSHVLANPVFGTVVTDRTLGFCWRANARENKITPWENDPVADHFSELVLLRTHGKIYDLCAVSERVRYGPGRAEYHGTSGGIRSKVTCFVPLRLPVKYITVEVENTCEEDAELELSYFVQPLMGVNIEAHGRYVTVKKQNNALIFENRYAAAFKGLFGFLACNHSEVYLCNDRSDFFSGAVNSLSKVPQPDPCAAATVMLYLGAREKKQISFALGCASSESEMDLIVNKLQSPEELAIELNEARQRDLILCGGIQIKTPDSNLDALVNFWLPYQSIKSRIWARTGFYQCGGAYGFRDQLQDCCAMLYTAPHLAKQHICRAAEHQFTEGDVQHWWHQIPEGEGLGHRGVRSRYSDDLLWLPYSVCEYSEKANDLSILDIMCDYIADLPLEENEKERYNVPRKANKKESIYNHCIKALEYSMNRLGEHGLCLFGGGDWNDGMNLVGAEGKGESVWLTWFLAHTLTRFSQICRLKGDEAKALHYGEFAQRLREAVEAYCWDGLWYIRGFYDNGSPLGSRQSDECKIDVLAQAFSVIAQGNRHRRKNVAMDSVWELLVDANIGILKLFSPPFVHSEQNPGYIKGYVAGIRENGGQYTHGALWGVLAYFLEGDGDRGYSLLKMLSPLSKSSGKAHEIYRIEPYVIAADVYANPSHMGRGGWSWYTGAAGWYYRVVLEGLLGLKIYYGTLDVKPCLPRDWQGFEAELIYKKASYRIIVSRAREDEGKGATIDGRPVSLPVRLSEEGSYEVLVKL